MPYIDRTGLHIETLTEITAQLRSAHKHIDKDWELDPSTPDGQKLVVDAQIYSNLNELSQRVYNSLDPSTADREALINLCKISGVTPQDSSPSTAIVTCSGIDGVFVPRGSRIRNTEDDVMWSLNSGVLLTSSGVDVAVTCTVDGAIQASPNKLTQIVDVVGGWTSVTNKAAASVGYDEESTKALRIRRNRSVSKPGSNQVDSMYGEIANVDDVKFVTIYENYETTPDSKGVAGHSVAIYVEGGVDGDVAKAIAATITVGAGMNKPTTIPGVKRTVKTLTPKGRETEVTFFRPQHVDVYIEIELVGANEQIADEIKKAIVSYSKGELIDDQVAGWDKTGFDIGKAVSPGKLYTPANRIVGATGYIKSIKVGRSADKVSVDQFVTTFSELPIFDVSTIKVKRTELV